ncbi:MAG: hypothetical protein NC923_00500 [Candidatus Omnitrophica bacterium]|nr:hypothetical protein [Candidatus Omnitrophota bacterium]
MRKDNAISYLKIQLPFKVSCPVLALGSQTKNTLCLLKGRSAYISPIHPSLDELTDLLSFERDARRLLRFHPKIIACDLHPGYQSTRFAALFNSRYKIVPVQHHHAHIASCMLENNLKNQKVIGVAFDGTGLGQDNRVWGAEFLLCDYRSYLRQAYLKEMPLLGGEKAILEPWRLACFWLYQIYGEDTLGLKIDFIKKIPQKKWETLRKLYRSGFDFPLASSMGRLFDAAAALVLSLTTARFEAELAVRLEQTAGRWKGKARSYPFRILNSKGRLVIDPSYTIQEIVSDLKARRQKEEIAYQFHLTLAEIILKICLKLKRKYGINKVVLSGGVFQNSLLLTNTIKRLTDKGFLVFNHKKLVCSDSSLSLGQAVVAYFGS